MDYVFYRVKVVFADRRDYAHGVAMFPYGKRYYAFGIAICLPSENVGRGIAPAENKSNNGGENMEKKLRMVGIMQIVAAVVYVLALVFILLDVSVFDITINEDTAAGDAFGLAIVFALSLVIQYPTAGISTILHVVVGCGAFAAIKKGKAVHKALLVANLVLSIVAAGAGMFFAITYFDTNQLLWGVIITLGAVVSLAAAILALRSGKQTETAV